MLFIGCHGKMFCVTLEQIGEGMQDLSAIGGQMFAVVVHHTKESTESFD